MTLEKYLSHAIEYGTKLVKVTDEVSLDDRCMQLAEECSELIQAILKRERYINGTNRPDKFIGDILDNMIEEMADVSLCLETLIIPDDGLYEEVEKIKNQKLERWLKRIESRNHRNTR